jgi:hypothetical protein
LVGWLAGWLVGWLVRWLPSLSSYSRLACELSGGLR